MNKLSIQMASIGFACAASMTAIAAEPASTIATKVAESTTPMDYINAKPLPLPQASRLVNENAQRDFVRAVTEYSEPSRPAFFSPGATGDGKTNPVTLGVPAATNGIDEGPIAEDFGTSARPFNTARADLYSGTTNTVFPYRAAGKLFFDKSASDRGYICSASMIKPGIVVTAAHCISAFGRNLFYTNFRFVPGYRNGAAPYGTWTATSVRVLTSWLNGTDSCAQAGVVCTDDVAVIALRSQNGAFPGNSTGWFGYGYGYGFTSAGVTQLTQIGYPAGLDNAAYMERNDSNGLRSASNANNTVIGSNMNGGSSGGPWVVNFGLPPTLTGQTNGSAPSPGIMVGVTSWGSTDTAVKQQGASPFTATNIGKLISDQCAATPGNC